MRFRSSKLTELNTEYQSIHKNYLEHQKSIVVEVIQTASMYIYNIHITYIYMCVCVCVCIPFFPTTCLIFDNM